MPSIIRGRFPSPEDLDRELYATLRGVGEDAELIFQAHALHKTGRLGRGIRSELVGGQVLVTAEARNPIGGYDYVGVTRFGHRVERIYPRGNRARASVVATGRRRGSHRLADPTPALRFTIGGRVLFRRSVRGFHPAVDWAAQAMPEVNAAAERAMRTLGRRIVTGRI